jgi:hypothetical protein
MALAIAKAALDKESAGQQRGGGGGDEARARAMAAAMVAWVEGQAQLKTDDGREIGRPPKHNFCFKCGAALHSTATFCADCGLKLPREGDTEVRSLPLVSCPQPLTSVCVSCACLVVA